MTPTLVSVIMVYSAIVAVLAAVTVPRRMARPRWLQAAAWTLQALLIGQAALAAVTIVRGQGPARPGLFLAYLAVAVALLPLCGAMAPSDRGSTSHDVRLAVGRRGQRGRSVATGRDLAVRQCLTDRGPTRRWPIRLPAIRPPIEVSTARVSASPARPPRTCPAPAAARRRGRSC